MAVVINNDSGLAEDLPTQESVAAIQKGTHSYALNDPQGNPVLASFENAPHLMSQGYTQPSPDQLNNLLGYAKYSSPIEQAKTAAEGAASTLSMGLSTGLERAAGVSPEDIRGRREVNPGMHALGSVAAFLAPEFGGTSLIGGAGRTVQGAEALAGSSALAGAIKQGAARAATEMALIQGGDEISKSLSNDPESSIGSAAINVGLSGLLGAGFGGMSGAISPLWKASEASKVGQLIEDFKGRLNYHLENPNPVQAVQEELGNYYGNVKQMADEVYGANGLKAQDIAKAMPEMGSAIDEQSVSINDKLADTINKMKSKPESFPPRLTARLENDLKQYQSSLMEGANNPEALFNATQDLKQTVQGYASLGKRVMPTDDAYDFVAKMKPLSNDLRTALEDTSVWGKAAERQQAINKAFTEYLPSLKDFEKRFTAEVGGEKVIDPGKINTYMGQLGKPNAEIKQEMLQNFLDASDKYRQTVADTHANLGLSAPFEPSSLATSKATLETLSPGARLADTFVRKGLSEVAGRGLGASVGAGMGHFVGAPGIGALIGQHALGPFFSSVLPALAKPIMENAANAEGLKTAVNYGMAAARGEMALKKAVNGVLQGGDVIPMHKIPSPKDIEKLDELMKAAQNSPTQPTQAGAGLSHYLPNHATALGMTIGQASNYLNSLRPKENKQGPLDPERVPNSIEKKDYDRALSIAEQPLMILKHMKDGSLNSKDIATLSAVHPGLYNNMKSKLVQSMIEHTAKGETIPYNSRLTMSLFLGQPLESSIMPHNVLMNQSVGMPTGDPNQQHGGAPRGSKQAFKQLPSMDASVGQARAAQKAKLPTK